MTVNALSGSQLAERVAQFAPGAVVETAQDAVFVESGPFAQIAASAKDDPFLDFQFLNSISAIDFIEHFQVVYHLTSLQKQHTGIFKVRLYGREEPSLPSVFNVWRGADFQEREIWDLMGIRFEGHPNLKRIMLWEGFEGHPLRKDFL